MVWRKQLHKSAIQPNRESIGKDRGRKSRMYNNSFNLDGSTVVLQVNEDVDRSADFDSEQEGHISTRVVRKCGADEQSPMASSSIQSIWRKLGNSRDSATWS